jgi:hypothetical protein
MSDNNGGNPRLDRVERMIEGLGEAHNRSKREMAEHRADFEREIAEHRAEYKREMAEHRAESKRERAERRAEFKREMAEHRAETNRDMRIIDLHLRRWAALGVKEARSQRKRHREIDLYITRLAAAQLVTEETLKNFMSSLGRGGNGNGRKSR